MKTKKLSISLLLLFLFNLISCTEEPIVTQNLSNVEISLSKVTRDRSSGRTEAVILNPHGDETLYNGDQVNIQWGFIVCGCDWASQAIHIDLYKGSTYIARLAYNVDFFDYEYLWTIPSLVGFYGSGFFIKITDVSNSANVASSETFSILNGDPTCGSWGAWKLTTTTDYYVVEGTNIPFEVKPATPGIYDVMNAVVQIANTAGGEEVKVYKNNVYITELEPNESYNFSIATSCVSDPVVSFNLKFNLTEDAEVEVRLLEPQLGHTLSTPSIKSLYIAND